MWFVWMLIVLLMLVEREWWPLWLLLASGVGLWTWWKSRQRTQYRTCPRCTASLRMHEQACDVCMWPAVESHVERPVQASQALHRMLYRFRNLGVVSQSQYDELLKASGLALLPKPGSEPATTVPAAFSETPPIAKTASVPTPRPETSVVSIPLVDSVSQPIAPKVSPPVQPPPQPVAGRAEAYAARRAEAAAQAAAEPPPAPKPKRDWAKVLQGFLEQHNIMWGELVGGLLIVCCSIALVISFWAEIAERPLLKFGIFSGVAAAMFAAGFYTDRRWKIRTTSHGVLMIAILLVPLNFLAIAAFTNSSPPSDLLSLGGEGVSLVLFATLTYLASCIITPQLPWGTTACVMVASLMQLVVRRFVGPEASTLLLLGMASVPLTTFAASGIESLRRTLHASELDAARAAQHLVLLGLGLFATLLPLALLLHKTQDTSGTIRQLSPLLAVLGGPLVATAIFAWRRLATQLVSLRIVTGSAGVLGGMMLLASLVLSWPLPASLLAAALVNAVVWIVIARTAALPRTLTIAAACLSLAWLIGTSVVAHDVALTEASSHVLASRLLSADAGASLAPMVALFAAIAVWLRRLGQEAEGHAWGLSAVATAIVSMALLLLLGFGRTGDLADATWYLALYGALATFGAMALDHRKLTWAAATLLLVSVVQGVVFRWGTGWNDLSAWLTALVLHAALLVTLGMVAWAWREGQTKVFRRTFSLAALATSLLAAAMLLGLGWQLGYNEIAGKCVCLAAVWMSLAWLLRNVQLFTVGQVALAAAAGVVVSSSLVDEAWFAEGAWRWVDPRFLHAQGIALAMSAIVWRVLRLWGAPLVAATRFAEHIDLRHKPWGEFDRLAEVVLLLLTLGLSAYAAIPGMGQELSPPLELGGRAPVPVSQFELAEIPSQPAGGVDGWMLLATTTLLVVAGCWDRGASLRLLTLYLLGAAACLFAATNFTDQTATASALRWGLSGFAVLGALPILARRQVRPWFATLGIELDALPRFHGNSLSQAGRSVVVGLVVLLYLAIAGFVSIASLRMNASPVETYPLFVGCGVLALVAGVGWMVLAGPVRGRASDSSLITIGQSLLVLLAAAPPLVVGAYVVARNLTQRPLLGPDPTSWFGELGNSLLYGGPLLLFALVLLAFAIRELSSNYAFAFALLMNGVATLVYLLELAARSRSLDAVAWIEVAQLNAAVAAITALAWWGAIAWRRGWRNPEAPRPRLLQVLALLSLAFGLETLIAGCWGVYVDPGNLTWQASVATPGGLVAVGLAALVVWLTTRPAERLLSSHHLGALAVLGVGLAANVVARFDTGQWQAYHTLLVGSAIAAWGMAWLPDRWRSTGWTMLFAVLTTLVTFREPFAMSAPFSWSSPLWPWWTIGGLLAVYGVMIRVAWTDVRRWPVWLGTPLALLAGNIWWSEALPNWRGKYDFHAMDFNIILLSVVAVVSLLVEVAWRKSLTRKTQIIPWSIGVHRPAIWIAIASLLIAVWAHQWSFYRAGPIAHAWLDVLAMAALLGATLFSLWDPRVRWPVAAGYLIGLAAVGRYVSELATTATFFTWTLAMALGAFVLATSYLWSRRDGVASFAIRLGAPQHLRERLQSSIWMLSANSLVSAAVIWLVTHILLTHVDFQQRMTAAYAILACALGLAFLAGGRLETVLRYVALGVGALFAIAFAWAWIPHTMPVAGLHRLVAAAVALVAVIPVYGTLLVKLWRRENVWTEAAQRTLPTLLAVAGGLLVTTLGMEVASFLKGQDVPLVWPAILAVALALAVLIGSTLAAAIVPGRDPLNLSERGRTAYVYATEVFLGLLFLHVRVTMPWLFGGWFVRFWPFIVMLIAFVGVGLSEWFARRKQQVLAEPLANTGILLPLLPVIGFWISASPGQYASLLLAVGGLYTMLSIMRKSPVMVAVAALAFNGSLWTMLHSVEGLGLLQHPQFWLIPPIACVLVAAQLNRSRMTPSQLSSVRYSCAVMIYAASTADIFINGVGEGIWMPMLLAGLAIVGVFAGILLRVRAFLFLGIAFLLVALFTVIWHAAVELERTYLWWVAGIVVGVAIIALFGLFEKKRDEALALVENLRKWEG